ncbi:hypothetical protein [Actinoplanes utahensis]|uniref:hypothetical protein n=1 Tax=Actinoplanes utahensis TaxID=1869 RepID=UPI00068C44EF|nr:hypothetical protein [Actinoplanes utahensis]GIF30890.1 hypothetical protein Aut01nite_38760 [Actinoplanes utahensis]
MSYAAPSPPAVASPSGGRPTAVTMAAVVLWTMAVAGLTYAVGVVAVTPGVVGRFRDAAPSSASADNFVTVIWLVAALSLALGLIFLALLVVLGAGLRRGSRLARAIALGVCGLGLVAGCATLVVLGVQRAGEAAPGTLSEALNDAYPSGWIVLNVSVAAAQVVAYFLVGALLLAAPREFFGGKPAGQFVTPATPSEWAVPQTKPFVTGGSEPDQFSDLPALSKSAPKQEDEYWSRPAE